MKVNGRCTVCRRPIPAQRPTPTLCGRPACAREHGRRENDTTTDPVPDGRGEHGDDGRLPLVAAALACLPGRRNRVWV